MTEIYFYSDAVDKLHMACRLSAKAVEQGARLVVYAQDLKLLEKMDKLLWTFQPTSFFPHCFMHDEAMLVRSTPIILSDRVIQDQGHTMLLNLHTECPPDVKQFQRVIEIASQVAEDKFLARNRYRYYQQAGYTLYHYKLDNH